MHKFIALGLSALALVSSAAVRADDAAQAAQATPATQAAEAAPAASAAQVAAAPASAAAKPQQHCWKEYRVGSNMPVTHCETSEDNDPQHQAQVRNIQNEITREAGAAARAPGGH